MSVTKGRRKADILYEAVGPEFERKRFRSLPKAQIRVIFHIFHKLMRLKRCHARDRSSRSWAMRTDRNFRPDHVRWVSQQILPHEADVRRWLRHSFRHQFNDDDAIQEAYSRIVALSDFSRITCGRAYLFTVV